MADYAVLHGAKKNCGDFLIRDAAIELVKTHLNVSEDDIFTVDVVGRSLTNSELEELANTEIAFLAGGPGYGEDFFPGVYPSMQDILQASTVVPLGPGWRGVQEESYTFTESSLNILNQIADQSEVPFLGARDLPTVRVLQKHGLPAKLTGCPAWYIFGDGLPNPQFESVDQFQNIAISTPSHFDVRHLLQYLFLLHRIQTEFPSAEVTCVFHRGKNKQGFRPVIDYPWKFSAWEKNVASIIYGFINLYGRRNNFELFDASGSSNYVQRYFDADIHIGYRVHAHIPSLSAGTPSFLLQVDGRGLGVSESLGTDADVWSRGGIRDPVRRLLNNIEYNVLNEFSDFKKVNDNLNSGYDNMSQLIDAVTS